MTILGVDHKIAACHSKIAKSDSRFKRIIKEVPLLHLQKMKVTNLCSAYKDAGLLHIIKYMHNKPDEDDIAKLLDMNVIRHATRHIKRLALALSLAFQIVFLESLSDTDAAELLNDLQCDTADKLASKWDDLFTKFVDERSCQSANFLLHYEMMTHAIEVIDSSLSERIGGPEGYSLLRMCMKQSLTFSYLNGASNYASFCTELLVDHTSAPPLIQGIKKRYYSVPYEGSGTNFGLDTLREEEHRKCKKFFRPRSDCNTVKNRMMRMEEAYEMSQKRDACVATSRKDRPQTDHSNWCIDAVDSTYIVRGATLVLKRKGLTEKTDIPTNVYAFTEKVLSMAMLDRKSKGCGDFLLMRFCCRESLFGIRQEDVSAAAKELKGPKELVSKILNGKTVTVKEQHARHLQYYHQKQKIRIKEKEGLLKKKKE